MLAAKYIPAKRNSQMSLMLLRDARELGPQKSEQHPYINRLLIILDSLASGIEEFTGKF